MRYFDRFYAAYHLRTSIYSNVITNIHIAHAHYVRRTQINYFSSNHFVIFQMPFICCDSISIFGFKSMTVQFSFFIGIAWAWHFKKEGKLSTWFNIEFLSISYNIRCASFLFDHMHDLLLATLVPITTINNLKLLLFEAQCINANRRTEII